MSKKETAWNWGFGFKWLVGCTLGTAVFGTLAYLSMWTIAEVIGDLTTELLGTMTAGLLFGGFFAFGGTLGPGWLLQGQGISAKSWIGQSVVVTAVAMSVSIALITSLFEVVPEPVSALFMGLVLGLPMGLVQGRLLRQSAIPSTWWPLINIAGYLCAAFIIVFFSGEGREWMIIIMGLLLGVDTGLGMMWLQREAAAHDLISYAD